MRDCVVSDSEDDVPIGIMVNNRKRKAAAEEEERKRVRCLNLVAFKESLSLHSWIDATFINTPHYIAASHYLPNWSMREALRELLTNTIDQARSVAEEFGILGEINIREDEKRLAIHIEHELLAEVTWKFGKNKYVHSYCNAGKIKARAADDDVEQGVYTMCIELTNYSSRLPWRSFQIGQTTKRGSKAMIGTHGEGLSAACVVLNRNGCNVTATCNHFSAKIVDLDNYIYFQLARRDSDEDTVKFKIVLPPPGDLVCIDELMSTIRLPSAAVCVKTERGQLLTAPEYRGKQYNRSIYVSEDAKCLFGYNFFDPDKNLLQSRDRNSHAGDACLRECGSILSEAILRNEDVCQRVLASFVYKEKPGAGGSHSRKPFSDLGDGEFLTEAARQRLRSAQERLSGQKAAIFCANDTSLLSQISAARDMAVVYCHAVLHNFQEVTNSFYQQLRDTATSLPEDSLLYEHRHTVCGYLRVNRIEMSAVELPTKLVGFWRVDRVAYVTGLSYLHSQQQDGAERSAPGLSEENEVNIHETLRACDVDLRTTIQIVRFLQGDAQRTRLCEDTSPTDFVDDHRMQLALQQCRAEFEQQWRREWQEAAVREQEQPVAQEMRDLPAATDNGAACEGRSAEERQEAAATREETAVLERAEAAVSAVREAAAVAPALVVARQISSGASVTSKALVQASAVAVESLARPVAVTQPVRRHEAAVQTAVANGAGVGREGERAGVQRRHGGTLQPAASLILAEGPRGDDVRVGTVAGHGGTKEPWCHPPVDLGALPQRATQTAVPLPLQKENEGVLDLEAEFSAVDDKYPRHKKSTVAAVSHLRHSSDGARRRTSGTSPSPARRDSTGAAAQPLRLPASLARPEAIPASVSSAVGLVATCDGDGSMSTGKPPQDQGIDGTETTGSPSAETSLCLLRADSRASLSPPGTLLLRSGEERITQLLQGLKAFVASDAYDFHDSEGHEDSGSSGSGYSSCEHGDAEYSSSYSDSSYGSDAQDCSGSACSSHSFASPHNCQEGDSASAATAAPGAASVRTKEWTSEKEWTPEKGLTAQKEWSYKKDLLLVHAWSAGGTQCSHASTACGTDVSTPGSCLGSAREGGAIESVIWRTTQRRTLEQQLQEETQETADGDADECTQCDDAASASSPLYGAHTQVDDDTKYSCDAEGETELNTSGLTDASDLSASLIAARSERSSLVHCAPTQAALALPAAVLHLELAEVFGREQSSNNTLQLVYCGTVASGVLLYDGLHEPATLQRHSAQLHQHPGATVLLTALCAEYKFRVVAYRCEEPDLPLAVRFERKGLLVNVTEGGVGGACKTMEALQGLLRTITLMDMLI
jgi:hypothetical protein